MQLAFAELKSVQLEVTVGAENPGLTRQNIGAGEEAESQKEILHQKTIRSVHAGCREGGQ